MTSIHLRRAARLSPVAAERAPDVEYDEIPEDIKRWTDAWKRVTEDEVPQLKRELENHFRDLLGVESDNQDGRRDKQK